MIRKIAQNIGFKTTAAAVFGTFGMMITRDAQFDGENVSTARHAVCIVYPTDSSEVFGIVSFSQDNITTPTKIVAGLRGLDPNSTFGLQILENGDLTEGVKTLGQSYQSAVSTQGRDSSSMYYKHSGDLGNVMTNEKGAGYSAFTNPYIKLFGESSVYGRSCGVFAEPNDQTTSLNKGKLLAAGVIGRSSTFKNLPPA